MAKKKRKKSQPKKKPRTKGTSAASSSYVHKLDPALHAGKKLFRVFSADDLVPVIIDCRARSAVAKKVDDWGGGCASVKGAGQTIVARVPRSKLATLARSKDVRYIEASMQLQLHCDQAHLSSSLVSETDSDSGSSSSSSRTVSQTGAGVLVGIVDTGIDVQHPAFRKNGKTRIVSYLDQFTDHLFGAAEIDAGEADAVEDTVGHGTHVAGIAAGNGAGSPSRKLEGVAPEADLAIVKSTLQSADILKAIAHIFELAGERSQPAVVNCSFGGHFGGHDGSTLVERTIDQLSGPGRIVVVSAGNEGNDPIHAHTVLRGDGASPASWEAGFTIKPQSFQTDAGVETLGALLLQVWQLREDGLRIELIAPSGQIITPPLEGSAQQDFGAFFVTASRQVHPYSGDPSVTFQIFATAEPQWLTGWRLVVSEASTGSSHVGAVHAWIRDGAEGGFVTGATFDHLIGMPASAYSAIAVGSYATRNEWSSRDPAHPKVRLDAVALEGLSAFTSRGPTRDGQNKPELVAPGEWLLAPLSSAAAPESLPLFTRASGMEYAALRGTSMSAPYVTGAVALLLEKDGELDWAEAKRRLIKSTRQDVHTGVCWNRDWGYGKLDVERLLTIEPTGAG